MSKILLIVTFVVILLLSISFKNQRKVTLLEAIAIAFMLILIVINKPPTLSDYHAYVNAFYNGADRMEPTFQYISDTLKHFNFDYIALFAVYGAISVSLKVFAIREMSPFFYLSILIWLSNTFFYHELIQIRVSVACGLLLWMIYMKIKGEMKWALVFFLLACLFHYSSYIGIFILFISKEKPFQIFYLLLIPVSYICYFLEISIAKLIPMMDIDPLIDLYDSYSSHDSEANVFNLVQIFRCLICIWLWIRVDIIKKFSPYFLIILKVFTVGCAVAVLFGDLIRVSFRLAELLWSVEIILFPFLIYSFYPMVKKSVTVPIAVGLILFYLMINNSHWDTGSLIV